LNKIAHFFIEKSPNNLLKTYIYIGKSIAEHTIM